MLEKVIPLQELEAVLKRLQAGTSGKSAWSDLGGAVQVRMDEKELRFTTTDGYKLVSVGVTHGRSQSFPDWSRIIPDDEPVATVQVDLGAACHALKSLKPATGAKGDDHVDITATAGMVTLSHVASGMAVTIAGAVTGTGTGTGAGDETATLARVNRAWLLGMLASLDSPEALLEVRGVMSPISIIPRGYYVPGSKQAIVTEENSPGSRDGRSGHHDGDVTIVMTVRR